jgi:Fe2+ or Zn2+ uptake regulation protein
MCQVEKTYIARNVLAYLSEHGDARDTLEGIVEWWLVEQRIIEQTAAVREVLDELVAGGLLHKSEGADSRTFYHVKRRAPAGEPPGV